MKKFFYVLSLFFLGFLLNGQQVFAQNPPSPVIALIQPDVSGIEWVFGETYMISWSDNFINGVDIILQDHNGNPDVPIATNVSGSTYLWTIDQATIVYPGSKFKIRVQSTVNGIYGDVSRKYFKILPYASNDFIKVEQPNVRHIDIQIGSDYLISWNRTVGGKFKIELFDDGGNPVNHQPSNSNVIAASVDGSTYTWNTTGWPAGSNLRVRVTSIDFPLLTDQSDKNFKLSTSVGSVTVLQPSVKNIVWQVGNQYLISWNDTFTETVDILLMDYTIPAAPALEATLAQNVVGSTWVWNTAGVAVNDNYRIRVQSSLDATKSDDSNKDFKLVAHTGSITVEQPNVKNIEWVIDNQYLISWIDNVDAPLDIFLVSDATYDANNPATWTLIEDGVVGSTFVWDIVAATYSVGDDYRILVATADKTIKDLSNKTFALVDNFGEIDVLQPNVGGIEWVIGNDYLISWIDNVEGPVNIELVGTGTVTIAEDDASNYGGGNPPWVDGSNEGFGFGDWEIFTQGGGNYFIDDPALGGITGMDNPSFGIIGSGAEVSADNVYAQRFFSQPMEVGSTFSFDWGINGNSGIKEFIVFSGGGVFSYELFLNIGKATGDRISIFDNQNVEHLISSNPGAGVMHFSFEYINATEIRVQANTRSGEPAFDQTFTVSAAPTGIMSYAEAQKADANQINHVSWFNNLKITKPFTADIATNVAGTTYVWNTTGYSPGNYKIRVYSGSIEDISDNTFKLVHSQGGTLTVNQPSAGDVWYKGYAYWVIWEDNIIEPLDVYLKNGALGYSAQLKDDFVGSMFDYVVPAGLANSNVYYIEIVSSTDPSLKFQSGLFTITDAIMMAVYPNPSSEYFNLRLDQKMEGVFDVIIYDRFNNRMIQTQLNAATKEHRINTAQLPNGIYFMQITNGKTSITEKIVVKH